MPKFNLELFKTLISNFAYIQRKKLSMFTLFQKYQFAYRNKSELATNWPISFSFIFVPTIWLTLPRKSGSLEIFYLGIYRQKIK